MARKIKERKIKNPTITIIGEGATERFYFTHLKRLNGYKYTCKPRNFTEQTFDEMQKQIERVLADVQPSAIAYWRTPKESCIFADKKNHGL